MSENYYQLLGLDTNYKLNKQQLTKNFRELQRSAHPDNFANHSDLDKRLSVQKSSQINDAFQTLKDPLKRAIYQLSLHDVVLVDNATTMDTAFLMEQMELREQLEKVPSMSDSMAALESMLVNVKQKLDLAVTQLGELFDIADSFDENKDSTLSEIKNTVLKMQFLSKFCYECEELEEDILNS